MLCVEAECKFGSGTNRQAEEASWKRCQHLEDKGESAQFGWRGQGSVGMDLHLA